MKNNPRHKIGNLVSISTPPDLDRRNQKSKEAIAGAAEFLMAVTGYHIIQLVNDTSHQDTIRFVIISLASEAIHELVTRKAQDIFNKVCGGEEPKVVIENVSNDFDVEMKQIFDSSENSGTDSTRVSNPPPKAE